MKELEGMRNKKRIIKDGWRYSDVEEEMWLATEKAEMKRVWNDDFGLGQH